LATRVPARLSPAEGRRFGLAVGGAFLALAALAWWRGRQDTCLITGTLGVLLALAGLAVPTRLGPVERGWTALARLLSKVTTPVFMSVMYFVVFAPAGLLLRACGHRTIVPNRAQATFWVSRGAKTRSDMHRQF
jgi:hypothetical protein